MNAIEKEFWGNSIKSNLFGKLFIHEIKQEWEKQMKKTKFKKSFKVLCEKDKNLGLISLGFYSIGYTSAKLKGAKNE